MTVRECARRHLRTVRPRDSATPAGNIPQSARGTLSAVRSVRHPSSSKFGNAFALSAKLLRRLSLFLIPLEEDVQRTFPGSQEGCRRLVQSGESMQYNSIGQPLVS
jgi:hypothetical protein